MKQLRRKFNFNNIINTEEVKFAKLILNYDTVLGYAAEPGLKNSMCDSSKQVGICRKKNIDI